MNQIARGRLDVEIRRHGQVIRTWVLKRIADTPVVTDEEREATTWFHNLPVAERSNLIKDLARINVKGVSLFEIATGPVGVLFTRYPTIFQIPDVPQDLPRQQEDEDLVETKEHDMLQVVGSGAGSGNGAGWYNGWKSFEFDLDGPTWPTN